MRYLESKLTELFRKLSEQSDANRTIRGLNDLNDILRQQAADWEKRYRELSARLTDSPNDSEKSRQARALIQRGQFDQAQAILEDLAAKQDAEVAQAAETQYNLGDLAMLRFDPASALPHYGKAFRYQPDNPLYADGYGRAAYQERDYTNAEKGWTAALALQRELAARDPRAYRPDVASTLNNLGILYRGIGRNADAKKAFTEALALYRQLAVDNPNIYANRINFLVGELAKIENW